MAVVILNEGFQIWLTKKQNKKYNTKLSYLKSFNFVLNHFGK